MVKIVNIIESPRKAKRFRALLSDGKKIDFGLDTGSTYIDHKDKKKRLNWWNRHYGNAREKELIDNLTMSPALLSAYILWGDSTDLNDNIVYLNEFLS
jgi:hypothetical protein